MPSGYTSGIYEGDDSFENYAWNVARGFGALIEMRDAPKDAAIPDEFTPNTTWNDERLEEARATLRRLERITPAEAEVLAKAEHDQSVARREEEAAKRDVLRERYDSVLAQVFAWDPPTPDHIELKNTMVEQLKQSIEFDCKGIEHWPVEPLRTSQEWVEVKREKAERDVEYHTAEREKAIERAAGRTAWVKALRDSLTAVSA